MLLRGAAPRRTAHFSAPPLRAHAAPPAAASVQGSRGARRAGRRLRACAEGGGGGGDDATDVFSALSRQLNAEIHRRAGLAKAPAPHTRLALWLTRAPLLQAARPFVVRG